MQSNIKENIREMHEGQVIASLGKFQFQVRSLKGQSNKANNRCLLENVCWSLIITVQAYYRFWKYVTIVE